MNEQAAENKSAPVLPEGKTTRKELEASGWKCLRTTARGWTFQWPGDKSLAKLSAQGFAEKV